MLLEEEKKTLYVRVHVSSSVQLISQTGLGFRLRGSGLSAGIYGPDREGIRGWLRSPSLAAPCAMCHGSTADGAWDKSLARPISRFTISGRDFGKSIGWGLKASRLVVVVDMVGVV